MVYATMTIIHNAQLSTEVHFRNELIEALYNVHNDTKRHFWLGLDEKLLSISKSFNSVTHDGAYARSVGRRYSFDA